MSSLEPGCDMLSIKCHQEKKNTAVVLSSESRGHIMSQLLVPWKTCSPKVVTSTVNSYKLWREREVSKDTMTGYNIFILPQEMDSLHSCHLCHHRVTIQHVRERKDVNVFPMWRHIIQLYTPSLPLMLLTPNLLLLCICCTYHLQHWCLIQTVDKCLLPNKLP